MLQFLTNSINSDTPTSSRRVILLFYAIFIGSLVYLAILVLGYVICLHSKVEKETVLQVYKYMLWLTGITLGFILLLAGVITWQNVNDSINAVKGLPQAIEKTHTEIDAIKTDAMDTITKTTSTTTTPGTGVNQPPPEQ